MQTKLKQSMLTSTRKPSTASKAKKDLPEADMYVCPVCGNTFEGNAPDICPICATAKRKIHEDCSKAVKP